jgi:hypothetical protein
MHTTVLYRGRHRPLATLPWQQMTQAGTATAVILEFQGTRPAAVGNETAVAALAVGTALGWHLGVPFQGCQPAVQYYCYTTRVTSLPQWRALSEVNIVLFSSFTRNFIACFYLY